MSNDRRWITTRVAESCEHYSLVTEAVSAKIVGLLNGELSERPLSSARLTEVARSLIKDITPASPNAEATQ